jgi:hypothetical protein
MLLSQNMYFRGQNSGFGSQNTRLAGQIMGIWVKNTRHLRHGCNFLHFLTFA